MNLDPRDTLTPLQRALVARKTARARRQVTDPARARLAARGAPIRCRPADGRCGCWHRWEDHALGNVRQACDRCPCPDMHHPGACVARADAGIAACVAHVILRDPV